ncbi:hypothetical protein PR048_031394 [Dryococelus australis]|uniref:Uncharacterized protein n=1 Tax=Dryococelus australis TaxID=614101 RepID=A0ABQ9G562_9NEOP|nr:hypothetical protein PR048_031394 [Dryococelus australis]
MKVKRGMEQRRNERGREKREIPEKPHRPAASFGAIPTCEIQGATPPGVEPGLGHSYQRGVKNSTNQILVTRETLEEYWTLGGEWSGDIWAALNSEVWSSAGMRGGGKREISEKTRQPAASSGTIPTCENPGATAWGIGPGSPTWEASSLTTSPRRTPGHWCFAQYSTGRESRDETYRRCSYSSLKIFVTRRRLSLGDEHVGASTPLPLALGTHAATPHPHAQNAAKALRLCSRDSNFTRLAALSPPFHLFPLQRDVIASPPPSLFPASRSASIGWWSEVSKEQRRNSMAGETGNPRENPPVSGIVRRDHHTRKSGSDPAGNRTRFAHVGSEQSGHYTTAACK